MIIFLYEIDFAHCCTLMLNDNWQYYFIHVFTNPQVTAGNCKIRVGMADYWQNGLNGLSDMRFFKPIGSSFEEYTFAYKKDR